jgi:two-component system phosphate regulon sensor histidine kinase PhoR
LKDLLSAIPLPALVIGATGRIEAANRRVEEILGGDLVGRHHVTILRQPSVIEAIERASAGLTSEILRLNLPRADRDLVFRTTATGFRTLGTVFVLVVLEDISRLEEAEQMRRDFVANVSHELKTPLTALTGFIETLRTSARDDPRARERFLAIMAREAARMNRLVSDLLALSRVEAEARVRPRDIVDLVAVTRQTTASLRGLLDESGATLVLTGAEAPVKVQGDADQLQQVAGNLIENAVKYGRAGGTITVTIGQVPESGEAFLSVADQGEGIDPAHIPRLTERFYRVDNHRSRESGGTGLGLAIVKHIVGRHRGRLKITSKQGVGSNFTVLLPLADTVSQA